jgi:hypothetical protein
LRRDIQDPEGRETREMPVFPEIKRSGWSCSMIARLGEQKIGLAEANSSAIPDTPSRMHARIRVASARRRYSITVHSNGDYIPRTY